MGENMPSVPSAPTLWRLLLRDQLQTQTALPQSQLCHHSQALGFILPSNPPQSQLTNPPHGQLPQHQRLQQNTPGDSRIGIALRTSSNVLSVATRDTTWSCSTTAKRGARGRKTGRSISPDPRATAGSRRKISPSVPVGAGMPQATQAEETRVHSAVPYGFPKTRRLFKLGQGGIPR